MQHKINLKLKKLELLVNALKIFASINTKNVNNISNHRPSKEKFGKQLNNAKFVNNMSFLKIKLHVTKITRYKIVFTTIVSPVFDIRICYPNGTRKHNLWVYSEVILLSP